MNPFSSRQLRIQDGRRRLSAPVHQKVSGILSITQSPIAFAVMPGFTNAVSYNIGLGIGNGPVTAPIVYPHWMEVGNRYTYKIQALRLVACALRFTVINNSEEDDGFWEAARVTTSDIYSDPGSGQISPLILSDPTSVTLSTSASYSRGGLPSLDRYSFRLNSIADEHPYTPYGVSLPSGLIVDPVTDYFDPAFDMIVIKIYGRQAPDIQTTLYYEVSSHFEVIYPGWHHAGHRFMTYVPPLHDWQSVLNADNNAQAATLMK